MKLRFIFMVAFLVLLNWPSRAYVGNVEEAVVAGEKLQLYMDDHPDPCADFAN